MSEDSTSKFRMLRKPEEFAGDPSEARLWMDAFKFCAKGNEWDNKVAAKRLPAFLS